MYASPAMAPDGGPAPSQQAISTVLSLAEAGGTVAGRTGGEKGAAFQKAVATAVATGGTASAVLAPAGPVGVIATVGVTAASGVYSYVKAVKEGRIPKNQAVQIARSMGIPDPGEVPGYVSKAFSLSPQKRRQETIKLRKALWQKQRPGINLNPNSLFRSEKNIKMKLAVLASIELYQIAELAGVERGKVQTAALVQRYAVEQTAFFSALAGGMGMMIIAAILVRRRRQAG